VAALLINRAGWMTDLLDHSLSAPEHPPVAEGLAVRAALRTAFASLGLDVVEVDEKSLRESAALKLPLSPGQIDVQLNALGASVGRPWRKEQKAACLAAWVAATQL
jgi:2-polyprenyl-6-methoxyphenol hydroxylase-like FAD-dependent oxidoreductase